MRERSNVTWAERQERSTVMRSQMLLISCAAVRVPAIATVSHSASKQRGLINPGASAAPPRCCKHEAQTFRGVLLFTPCNKDYRGVNNGCESCLCFHFPKRINVFIENIQTGISIIAERVKRCRSAVNQSIKPGMTPKHSPHSSTGQ